MSGSCASYLLLEHAPGDLGLQHVRAVQAVETACADDPDLLAGADTFLIAAEEVKHLTPLLNELLDHILLLPPVRVSLKYRICGPLLVEVEVAVAHI